MTSILNLDLDPIHYCKEGESDSSNNAACQYFTGDPYPEPGDFTYGVTMDSVQMCPGTSGISRLFDDFDFVGAKLPNRKGEAAGPYPFKVQECVKQPLPEEFGNAQKLGWGLADEGLAIMFQEAHSLISSDWEPIEATPLCIINGELSERSHCIPDFVHRTHSDVVELSKTKGSAGFHALNGILVTTPTSGVETTDDAAVAFKDTDGLPAPCREHLEVTSLHSSGCKAPELANHMVHFLQMQSCQIIKINKLKFSIKAVAQTSMTLGDCEIKIRFYREQDKNDHVSNEYAIEFQRRCGDSIKFMSLYREAAKYLKHTCRLSLEDPPKSPRY